MAPRCASWVSTPVPSISTGDIAADSEFEDSYVEWLQLAEEKAKELQGRGLRLEKVDLDSENLMAID